MGLVDELNKLSELHESGQLSDAEFDEAKTKLIRDFTGSGGSSGTSGGDTAGGMAAVPPSVPPAEEPPPGTFQPTTTVRSAGATAPPPPPAATPSGGTQPGVMPGSYGARPLSTPTTTIRSGLGTGSVTLGGTSPVTRLRYGGSAPGVPRPSRSIFSSLIWLTVLSLFVALMFSTVGSAIFPGLARLAAPLICEAPFDHSYVDVVTTPGDEAGETNVTWDLQCYNDDGVVQSKGTFQPMAYLFLGSFALIFLVGLLLVVIRRLRRGSQGDEVQVAPEMSADVLSGAEGPVVNPPT